MLEVENSDTIRSLRIWSEDVDARIYLYPKGTIVGRNNVFNDNYVGLELDGDLHLIALNLMNGGYTVKYPNFPTSLLFTEVLNKQTTKIVDWLLQGMTANG